MVKNSIDLQCQRFTPETKEARAAGARAPR
jgi:hypothetical protein